MRTVTEQAYGKINLYLDVLGKREDGYHNIESVMQTVSLCDTVTVTEADDVSMTCTDPTLTCGEDNLCIKAARAFFSAYPVEGGGCRIALTKTLPREAGLGGGSADAAAVLRALNRLHGEPFSTEALCAIGAKIGADVPFCVQGKGAALAEGIGEILSPFPSLPDCHIVISNGIGRVSTPRAYRTLDETAPTATGDLNALKTAMKSGDLKECGTALYNRFEDAHPVSRTVVSLLDALGAEGARMTGSGAAVFGIFSEKEKASHACTVLEVAGLKAYLSMPV
ncbi:MAG: 4-(cytidine 5'-diphospho)-2-C-methyl-D-erythritol kinase [Clostridia bacterium]|nr:4-(cytidine 5'-diphospho)-2-C-methyl-D-erythritol kinase [Clostridia bacterium]